MDTTVYYSRRQHTSITRSSSSRIRPGSACARARYRVPRVGSRASQLSCAAHLSLVLYCAWQAAGAVLAAVILGNLSVWLVVPKVWTTPIPHEPAAQKGAWHDVCTARDLPVISFCSRVQAMVGVGEEGERLFTCYLLLGTSGMPLRN